MSPELVAWIGGLVLASCLLILIATASLQSFVWKHHGAIAQVAAGLVLASLPFLFTLGLSAGWVIAVASVQVTLFLVAARLVADRLHGDFLRSSTLLNALGLAGILAGVFVSWALLHLLQTPSGAAWFTLVLVGIFVAAAFGGQVLWTLKHYRLRKIDQHLSMRELPTVTLAIPARNETAVLTECLQAAIASDYPKLEIIVLDDCSQDKTSQIIRSFAHDGVRFVQGEVPAESWIGKNQACQTLAQQAEGEFIVFSDVDTRLAPQSITKLVTYALSNHADMVSVLPQADHPYISSNLLRQLRYYWQIVLPITRHRAPVASQCWLIRAKTLKELGGFAGVKHKITPESTFARELYGKDQYRFIISNPEVGVTNAKKWSSQLESALRIIYPDLRRQPMVTLLALWFVGLLLAPFCVLIWQLGIMHFGALFWLSLLASLLLYGTYLLVTMRTNPRLWPLVTVCFPLVLVQEATLIIVSTLAYEFSEVNWKGRNVCYPVINYAKK